MRIIFGLFILIVSAGSLSAQADDFCSEAGINPSLDSPFAHIPYVFGKIVLQGFDPGKTPKVTVILTEAGQSPERWMVEKSGKYCFKRKAAGGLLVVEVDGIEAARRTLPAFGSSQQREDFEIFAAGSQKSVAPAVVTAKFVHPANPNTIELYKKTVEAETNKDPKKAIEHLKEIVKIDPADFIAWAKLGSLQFEQKAFPEADMAFRRSLELRVDYTPAWINVGQLRVAQNNTMLR